MLLVAVPVKVALTRRLPDKSVESRTWSPAVYVGFADEATAGSTPKLFAIGAALLCVRVPVTRRLSLASLRNPTIRLLALNDMATVPVKLVAVDAVPSTYWMPAVRANGLFTGILHELLHGYRCIRLRRNGEDGGGCKVGAIHPKCSTRTQRHSGVNNSSTTKGKGNRSK